MLNLDILAFNQLAETAMRLHYRERLEAAVEARMIQHDLKQTKKDQKGGKGYSKHVATLARLAGGEAVEPGGDDLQAALSTGGNG